MEGYDEYAEEYADPEETLMALQGAYGDEAKAEALDALGLELDDGFGDDEEGYEHQDENAELEAMASLIEGQTKALERAIGRELSDSEWRQAIGGISFADLEQGVVPDLVSRHAEELSARTDSADYRIERGAEGAQRVIDQDKATEEGPLFADTPAGASEGGEGEYEGEEEQ
jgi:hypothetical protein